MAVSAGGPLPAAAQWFVTNHWSALCCTSWPPLLTRFVVGEEGAVLSGGQDVAHAGWVLGRLFRRLQVPHDDAVLDDIVHALVGGRLALHRPGSAACPAQQAGTCRCSCWQQAGCGSSGGGGEQLPAQGCRCVRQHAVAVSETGAGRGRAIKQKRELTAVWRLGKGPSERTA